VTVSPAKGAYYGQVERRAYVVELAATSRPRIVNLNANALTQTMKKVRTLRVRVPSQSIHKAVTVSASY